MTSLKFKSQLIVFELECLDRLIKDGEFDLSSAWSADL